MQILSEGTHFIQGLNKVSQMKFQGKLVHHCQKQLNMHGKKIPDARTKRNNKQQKDLQGPLLLMCQTLERK